MPYFTKCVCDGPQCEKTYEIAEKDATTKSAPFGWLSAVKLRIAPPRQSLADLPIAGDFCSEWCLLAKLKEQRERAHGWSDKELTS